MSKAWSEMSGLLL